jgi:hypothetical protein
MTEFSRDRESGGLSRVVNGPDPRLRTCFGFGLRRAHEDDRTVGLVAAGSDHPRDPMGASRGTADFIRSGIWRHTAKNYQIWLKLATNR